MQNLFSLDGKTALVTGASGGLGRHFADVLAQAGAAVVLAARRTDRLEVAAHAIRATGGSAFWVEMDVTDPDSVVEGIDRGIEKAGPIHVIVNNAGIARTKRALDLDRSTWSEVLGTNLDGPWWVAQAAARKMVAQGTAGSIINIASVLGLRVTEGLAPYTTSKAALIQLTRALAIEWARHAIRVNAVAPGYIATDINRKYLESEAGAKMIKRIPQRRVGEPRDLNGAMLLLASDASRYMTGSTVVVDGGHSHAPI